MNTFPEIAVEQSGEVHESAYRRLAELRFLVGHSGERDVSGWWDTAFLTPTGLRYAEINFPRSAVSAAGVSASEAARRVHDDHIGRGGVFHLFRLPPSIEEAVHQEMLRGDHAAFKELIADRDTVLNALEQMAGRRGESANGPVQIGEIRDILTTEGISDMARHYLDAFIHGKRVFPYFLGEDE